MVVDRQVGRRTAVVNIWGILEGVFSNVFSFTVGFFLSYTCVYVFGKRSK